MFFNQLFVLILAVLGVALARPGGYGRPGGFGPGAGFNENVQTETFVEQQTQFGGNNFPQPGFGGNNFAQPGFAGNNFGQSGFGGSGYSRPGGYNPVKLRSEVRKFPLTGIKVALLNRPSIGDFAAKILEDYGAEVKKFSEVENFPIPNKDWTNSDFIKLYVFGTLQPHEKNGKSQETRIDLTRKEDINLIKNIANKVDVIIDCLEAQRLEKVGLDPKEMLKLNSKLIVARITGYGQTGTFAPRTGADTTFSALSGAMSGIESSEDPTEEGLKIATRESKALTMAGRSNCVTGVILALYDREHTGKGQIVDMSLTESIAYVDRVAHLTKLQVPKTFHRFYSTLDKKLLAVGILNPNDQQKFLQLIGANAKGDLEKNVAEKISQKKISDWISILKDIGSVAEVLDHSNVGTHKQHRERDNFDLEESSNKWIPKSSPRFSPNSS